MEGFFFKFQNPPKFRHLLTVKEKSLNILPGMNPDGFETRNLYAYDTPRERYRYYVRGREAYPKNLTRTRRMVDLNRDFPEVVGTYHNSGNKFEDILFQPKKLLQGTRRKNHKASESQHVSKFIDTYQMDYAISYHDGVRVVNYPLDSNAQQTEGKYAKSLDDTFFIDISKKYASAWDSNCNTYWNDWDDMIVNGAAWYDVRGGFQDYHYLMHGTYHLTIEVNCIKFTDPKNLHELVGDNMDALVTWMQYVSDKPLLLASGVKPGRLYKLESGDITLYTRADSAGYFRKFVPNSGKFDIYLVGETADVLQSEQVRAVNGKRTFLNLTENMEEPFKKKLEV